MALIPPISRRLLLGHLGSGTGIIGTFLLPSAALAAAATSRHSAPAAPARQGARPPPPLVMLDPGHGGKDPGAIGISDGDTLSARCAISGSPQTHGSPRRRGRWKLADPL